MDRVRLTCIMQSAQIVSKKYWPANAVCESIRNYWALPYDMLPEAGIKIKMVNQRNAKIIAQAKLVDDKVDSAELQHQARLLLLFCYILQPK